MEGMPPLAIVHVEKHTGGMKCKECEKTEGMWDARIFLLGTPAAALICVECNSYFIAGKSSLDFKTIISEIEAHAKDGGFSQDLAPSDGSQSH